MCRVRFHYGHPDVFDRLFHLTRGGISKASKIINLSEDIFAGMFMIYKLHYVFSNLEFNDGNLSVNLSTLYIFLLWCRFQFHTS